MVLTNLKRPYCIYVDLNRTLLQCYYQNPVTLLQYTRTLQHYYPTIGKEILTVQEYADRHQMSMEMVRRKLRNKEIPATKKNNKWIIEDDNTTTTLQQDHYNATTTLQHKQIQDSKDVLESSTNEYTMNLFTEQLQEANSQINELLKQQNQAQQLSAMQQKTIDRLTEQNQQLSQQNERQQLQIEDMRRNRSIFARIREVFIPSNT